MAVYGIGASYDREDVSDEFIEDGIIGTGWTIELAPELHQYFSSLKVGDIVYIKSVSPNSDHINVKAIGIVRNNIILTIDDHELTQVGRYVRWLNTDKFNILKPSEKNNVRLNTLYEEFHPLIQEEIIQRL